MSKALTMDQLEAMVKRQLINENYEIRRSKEYLKEIPLKAFKNAAITTSTGVLLTASSSFFAFRKMDVVKKDVAIAVPVLGMYSAVDFSVNYTLTKLSGRIYPTRLISTASGAAAGACCGYHFGHHQPKPTVFGCAVGALYGYMRNTPMEMFGLENF